MRLQFIVCKVMQREAYFCAARSKNIVDVVLIEQGLHTEPDRLRATVQKALERTADIHGNQYDASVLGYGLCGNGIVGLSAKIPIVVSRGHDCVTLLLGSKERYKKYLDSHKGVYWYSPGWIETGTQPGTEERCEKLLKVYKNKYGDENTQYLMEIEQDWMKKYSRAVYIDWNLGDNEHYKKHTRDCAESLGWKYDELQGDPGLLQRLLDGQWNESEFLFVKLGANNQRGPL